MAFIRPWGIMPALFKRKTSMGGMGMSEGKLKLEISDKAKAKLGSMGNEGYVIVRRLGGG